MEPKDEIKQRLDIAEVISEYIPIKPSGSGSFKAVCPFHNEKTPSFHISTTKEIWHCFGCGKGGDVISFVMEIEGMSFPEAMQFLAKKAGVALPEFKPDPRKKEKTSLVDLHQIATKFYEALLWQHPSGAEARAYVESRGIPQTLAQKFQLGYAPDSWDSLVQFFQKRRVGDKALIQGGLAQARQKGTGSYDRFRNRLLIPLHDRHGNVIGFTGRALKPEDTPKYLNSPETPIYHKGKVLYGLHLAKTGIRQEQSVIIVEGNLDVIASHKAGVEHVVASSGTALTEDQLRLLKKYTSSLIFCFDRDEAGYKAARRGMQLAQSLGFELAVIAISEEDGKDPDDVVQKNPERWKFLAANPIPVMQYYFDRALDQFDVQSPSGKRDFSKRILEELAHVQSVIEQEHWLQKLADTIQIDLNVLRGLLKKTIQATQAQSAKTTQKSVVDYQNISQNTPPMPDDPDDFYGQPISTKMKKPEGSENAGRLDRVEKARRFLLGLVLADKEWADIVIPRFAQEYVENTPWEEVYKTIVLLYTQSDSSDSTRNIKERLDERIFTALPDQAPQLRGMMVEVMDKTALLDREQVREEINRHFDIIVQASKEQERKSLQAAIREAERSGDNEKLQELLARYTKLL